MIHQFHLIKGAYDAVVSGKKDIEVRLKGTKKMRRGDYILFKEYHGTRRVCVRVREVVEYENISALRQSVREERWRFYPKEDFDTLVEREFISGGRSEEAVLAIFFSLPALSVIIPFFNAARYFEFALASLAVQTFKDFGIIAVNDGSSDDSEAILERYSQQLPVICERNTSNLGAAASRNCGLSLANGKYVLFLDSDDIFSPVLFERLVDAGEKYNADISIAEYDDICGETGYESNADIVFSDPLIKEMSRSLFSFDDIPARMNYLINVPWNKLFRRAFLLSNGLRFQNLPSSNDVYFCNMAMMLGRLIHVCDESALVHYRVLSKDGISSRRNPFCEHKAHQYLFEQMRLRNIPVTQRVSDMYLYEIFRYLRNCSKDYHDEYFSFLKETFLHGNQLVSADYIAEHHPCAVKLFENHASDYCAFKLKLEVIETLSDRDAVLQKTTGCSRIGIYSFSVVSEYFRELYGNDFESIVPIKNANDNCDCIISLSCLQSYHIKRYLAEHWKEKIKLVALFL